MTSRPILKGLRLICVFPAAYLLDWMMTLTVSIGWMTQVATHPEMDPTAKDLNSALKTLSLGFSVVAVVDAMFNIFIN